MDDIGESEQKISYYSVISALEIIANTTAKNFQNAKHNQL